MHIGQEIGIGRAEVVDLRERLAETRHNEVLGWGAVLISALLVLTLSLLSPMATMLSRARYGPETAVAFSPLGGTIGGIDVVAGLLLLSATLVVIGVALALYCRFVRSRLFVELRATIEAEAALNDTVTGGAYDEC
ncbi:MAG: hypothetical protein JW846_07470 [Dehalococcoidia bacterium]|nr:hypothetical protein [Dehalococcoidia bacterium]